MRKGALAVAGLAGIVALWIFLGIAPPRGAPATISSEYPLGEGLRWIYRGDGNIIVVREIDRAVEIGGRRYWEMRFVLPVLGTRMVPMRYAEGGVVTAREGREFLLLRFPMVKGDSWTIDLPSEREVVECTVLGDEEIEYAGRKGKATKLEVRRRTRDGRAVATDAEWYAPGIGLVKMKVTLGVRATFVLESFGRTK